eukprot:Skav228750  [mRNA]  locus=scaffold1034:4673:6050:+ [translate_table: standard]
MDTSGQNESRHEGRTHWQGGYISCLIQQPLRLQTAHSRKTPISCSLGPVKGCSLHRGLTSVAQLLLPARVDLVSILLEGQESTLDLLMGLGILNHTITQADVAELAGLPLLPGLLTLTARDGTNLGSILVTERATTSGQDHVGVSQVLEEGWQAQGVHTTRDDGGGLLHALPLLTVVRTICLVILQHVSNVLVGGITLHLAKAHGAHVDAGSTDDSGDLGVHEGSVTTLGLRAGH